MRINTDGVLLGSVASHTGPAAILDIGTGTGVIALMMAQRFPRAKIDAVEIDDLAAQAAAANFKSSAFANRTAVHQTDIAHYATEQRYDLIVANPPYFVNDLKNKEKRKELARHADESFFTTLLDKTSALLTAQGALWLILPVKQAEWVVAYAVLHGLFPAQILHVHSDEQKPEFRRIICLVFQHTSIRKAHFYIYKSPGVYTEAYKQLLKDFFLGF